MTENHTKKVARLKTKHKEFCISDKCGRGINGEDVDWLIEQAEKTVRYEQLLQKFASQSQVREGYILAPQIVNNVISSAKQALKISEYLLRRKRR